MNVLFVAAESVPFAKTGGLADVVGSLPQALRARGLDARVMIPGYGSIDWGKHNIEPLFDFHMPHHTGTVHVRVAHTVYDSVPVYFIQAWPYLGDGNFIYTDVDWDIKRFVYFCQVAMGTAWELYTRFGWFPDVFHTHDWHTGALSFLLNNARSTHQQWAQAASMLTVHNLGYQGWEGAAAMTEFGIPPRYQPDLVYQEKADNLLAIGLAYTDEITVVSPRYADEIQYPSFGEGLEGLIRIRAHQGDLYGILNGLDVERFNPATDPNIPQQFDVNSLDKRIINKRALQQEAGLDVRDDAPVIGVVSRLVAMKGMDLAIPALEQMLANEDIQLVILGTGEPEIEDGLSALGTQFHWKARIYVGFDAPLAQRIYAGSDMFLMPSRYEPCGIGQMLAMRYGSLPLVRETGGLADTVENYDDGAADRGTGFTFLWENADAVLGTLRWAAYTYRYRQDAWLRMQKRAMQQDFSWARSADEYIKRYEKALAKHRP